MGRGIDILNTKVVTRERARELDKIALEKFNIPTLLLMENAGKGVAEVVQAEYPPPRKILIIAGRGNNGGDGYCSARHLINAGYKIKTLVLAKEEEIRGDALLNLKILKELTDDVIFEPDLDTIKSEIKESDVIMDAIFGTGLAKDVKGFELEVIRAISGMEVVSVDIPSGLDSNTGFPRPEAVKAKHTVTFAPAKVGLFVFPAPYFTGKIHVKDITIPKVLWENSEITLVRKEILNLRDKKPNSHKGYFGHALLVVGGLGRAGACILAGLGSLKVGAGLTSICTPRCIYEPVASGAPEYMVHPTPDNGRNFTKDAVEVIEENLEGKTALGFGCGVWVCDETWEILKVLAETDIPLVIDADGITLLAQYGKEIIKGRKNTVLTPHPGEMARLFKTTPKEIQADRLGYAKMLSEELGVITVLKGARTVTTDGKNIFINMSGNPGLAEGGTGDVLTGIITGLCAQGYDTLTSSVLGVFLHGHSADIILNERGKPWFTAKDVAEKLPYAIADIST